MPFLLDTLTVDINATKWNLVNPFTVTDTISEKYRSGHSINVSDILTVSIFKLK
jgi:hypothetical protein